MSKVDFNQSQVPDNYSKALNAKQLIFGANYTEIIGWVSFAAVGDLLRKIKVLDKPTAFVMRDETGEIVVAAIVKHIPSEDPEHPEGNWSYVWTFDKDDVTEDTVVAELTNEMNHQPFVSRAGNKHGMEYATGCLVPMHVIFFQILKEWLITNAKEGEELEIELPNVFLARSSIEDGETVISIEPLGKMVQLIKDDADLEV